jgi:hypothetical protein
VYLKGEDTEFSPIKIIKINGPLEKKYFTPNTKLIQFLLKGKLVIIQ